MNPMPEIIPMLKQLRLSGILDSLETRNRQAVDEKFSYMDFLATVITDEIARRNQKKLASALRRANFRNQKTLEEFDTRKAKVVEMRFFGGLSVEETAEVLKISPQSVMRDWKLARAFYQRFKYQNITTDQVIAFFNRQTGMNLTPIFDQYLRFTDLPTLDLAFQDGGQVAYRWHADVPGFAMPVKVGSKDKWQIIRPTTEWQVMTTPLSKDAFEVATDLYFVNVSKQ